MEEIKVVIADDDPSSRMLLAQFTKLLPDYTVAGEAASGNELLELVMKEKPEIVLLDIQMPDLNGVEAARACKMIAPSVHIIFTTGHEEYAVEAFNLSAVDYLVKPIERTRFFMALEKARKSIAAAKAIEVRAAKMEWKRLAIKSNQTFAYVPVEEILFIEKEGRKSVVHTVDERFETHEPLLDLEERLPDYFHKTHRSYLVNLKKIVKIEALGETYSAHFANCEKTAYISKLKINEIHRLMGT
ncbi:LytR/AlgR family response regulator transcription factor [Bacillus salipaludis]|uniref:LytTR family DNA-binding domain-containing protein n=1 Tax=Bacillus salipaludis TaxID=2547811 RepID=A0AA90R1S0_9BACI|nr:LytTR family DNA-binding domain-containing protein [Bacillus salipaludis]MDQ6595016.1 LytTR family DNA-binding domain-containing protein [Bacillus salipaludis]